MLRSLEDSVNRFGASQVGLAKLVDCWPHLYSLVSSSPEASSIHIDIGFSV